MKKILLIISFFLIHDIAVEKVRLSKTYFIHIRGYPYIDREKSKQTLGIFCNKTTQYLDLKFGLIFIEVLKNMKIFYLLHYNNKQIRLDA